MKARIDKWLWSVRIFKSRTLATEMCKSGKIKVDDVKVKASHQISEGDIVFVLKNGYQFQFKALKLLSKRVSATIAATAYKDLTPEAELRKYEDWFVGKARPEFRERGAGRPTKRERRDIDDFKTDYYFSD